MKRLLSLCMVLAMSGMLSAKQPGFIDASFKSGGGANHSVNTLLRQKDGKLLVAGRFTTMQGRSRNRIARLLKTGSLDLSFNPGTGADSELFALAQQSGGRLLIGGEFTHYNDSPRNPIARLNADGSLDASFDPGAGADAILHVIVIQPDGRLLIGGEFDNYGTASRRGIARLNADGSLDTSFDPGTGFNGTVAGIALLSDGRMVVAGEFTDFNGTACNRVARLNSNGMLDATFNPGGAGLDSDVRAMVMQPDGRILLAGTFTQANGTSRNRIARLNANGALDASFKVETFRPITSVVCITSVLRVHPPKDFSPFPATAGSPLACAPQVPSPSSVEQGMALPSAAPASSRRMEHSSCISRYLTEKVS